MRPFDTRFLIASVPAQRLKATETGGTGPCTVGMTSALPSFYFLSTIRSSCVLSIKNESKEAREGEKKDEKTCSRC